MKPLPMAVDSVPSNLAWQIRLWRVFVVATLTSNAPHNLRRPLENERDGLDGRMDEQVPAIGTYISILYERKNELLSKGYVFQFSSKVLHR